jgi:uncharacterized protein (TIGR03435 family)
MSAMQGSFGAWMRIAAWGMGCTLYCAAASAQTSGAVAVAAQVAAGSVAANTASTTNAVRFDVATIKPSDPKNCCGYFWTVDGMQFKTGNTSLRWLIRFAYALNDKQLVGGPEWMDHDLYDVAGRFQGTKPFSDPQCRTALQKLLVERFGLKFHQESREMSAYVLTAPRGTAKLTKSDPKKDTEQELIFSRTTGKTMHGMGRDVSLHDFAGEIQRLTLDRPLVDRTGIAGTFDLDLEFTWEDPNSLGMTVLPENASPNLLTALNEQLGLKLQTAKTAVDVIVVDHAELPSAN